MSFKIKKTSDKNKYLLGLKLCQNLDYYLWPLYQYFGDFLSIWEASQEELVSAGMPAEKASQFLAEKSLLNLDYEYTNLLKENIQIISIDSVTYPDPLKHIASPPPILFIKGTFKPNYLTKAVAIVGSRKATPYGKVMARKLAEDLAQAGITVVSGLARGIDSAAHEGALAKQGYTIGVLGCGIDLVYPPENRALYGQIAESGCLISEFSPGQPPFGFHFPQRNRIISALSSAVIVVEASLKSGALITVDLALEQGREVFAVPGPCLNKTSEGCHKLIKEGAMLVETANDILETLGWQPLTNELALELNPTETKILNQLDWQVKRIDEIALLTGLEISEVASYLVTLEIKGLVRKDITGGYLRNR
jgi:DNA processing protein